MLKGGLVVELRVERARTTKDVDLRLTGSPEDVLRRLQEAGRLDLGDFLTFEIGPDAEHPEIQNDGMQYEEFMRRQHRDEARSFSYCAERPGKRDAHLPTTGRSQRAHPRRELAVPAQSAERRTWTLNRWRVQGGLRGEFSLFRSGVGGVV